MILRNPSPISAVILARRKRLRRPNGSFYEESSMICVPVAVILAAIGLVLEIIRILFG